MTSRGQVVPSLSLCRIVRIGVHGDIEGTFRGQLVPTRPVILEACGRPRSGSFHPVELGVNRHVGVGAHAGRPEALVLRRSVGDRHPLELDALEAADALLDHDDRALLEPDAQPFAGLLGSVRLS